MNSDLQEYIKNWLYRANEDLSVCHELLKMNSAGFTSTICFHAQQSVEKFLKTYLVANSVDYPKTHDVDFLLKECIKINNTAFIGIDLGNLSEFGVLVRYPDDFYIPDNSEAIKYANIALEIKTIVELQIIK
jgi:HEPN domain-containing protein